MLKAVRNMLAPVFRARLSIAGVTHEQVPVLIYPGSTIRVQGSPAQGVVLVEVDESQVEVLESDLEKRADPISDAA